MKELRTRHVIAMTDGRPCVASVDSLSKCLGPKVLPRIFQKMLGRELENPGGCVRSATHPEVGSQQPQSTQKPDGASLDPLPRVGRQMNSHILQRRAKGGGYLFPTLRPAHLKINAIF